MHAAIKVAPVVLAVVTLAFPVGASPTAERAHSRGMTLSGGGSDICAHLRWSEAGPPP